MPIVPYTASSFSGYWGPRLSGHHTLTLSWNEILWAAMTMGKPGVAFLLSHGWHSVSDLIVRSHTVYANLREHSSYIRNQYGNIRLVASLDIPAGDDIQQHWRVWRKVERYVVA